MEVSGNALATTRGHAMARQRRVRRPRVRWVHGVCESCGEEARATTRDVAECDGMVFCEMCAHTGEVETSAYGHYGDYAIDGE
jgi:hypothetical protein